MKYLRNVSPSTAKVYDTLQKLTSAQAKTSSKNNTTMEFQEEKQQLYLEINAWGVGLDTSHLQVKDGIWFPRIEAPSKEFCGQ